MVFLNNIKVLVYIHCQYLLLRESEFHAIILGMIKTSKMLVGVLAINFLFVSCASSTIVRSTDPGAKIYIDGEFKGKGSVTHSDTKIVGSSTSVKLVKEGCEPEIYNFSRNEEFDAGACVGGVLVLFPFLWIQKYKAEHVYEYSCTKSHK